MGERRKGRGRRRRALVIGGSCGDVEPALRPFEDQRLAAGKRIIERARHLGSYLQAGHRTAAEHVRSKRHSIPEAVLAETAVLDFLYA